jgi:hypothetical protein
MRQISLFPQILDNINISKELKFPLLIVLLRSHCVINRDEMVLVHVVLFPRNAKASEKLSFEHLKTH